MKQITAEVMLQNIRADDFGIYGNDRGDNIWIEVGPVVMFLQSPDEVRFLRDRLNTFRVHGDDVERRVDRASREG